MKCLVLSLTFCHFFPLYASTAAYVFENIWIITSISLCWDRLSSLADESFARGIQKILQIFVDIIHIMLFSCRWNPPASQTKVFLLHEASRIHFIQEGSLPMMSVLLLWRRMTVSIFSKEILIIQFALLDTLFPTGNCILHQTGNRTPDSRRRAHVLMSACLNCRQHQRQRIPSSLMKQTRNFNCATLPSKTPWAFSYLPILEPFVRFGPRIIVAILRRE